MPSNPLTTSQVARWSRAGRAQVAGGRIAQGAFGVRQGRLVARLLEMTEGPQDTTVRVRGLLVEVFVEQAARPAYLAPTAQAVRFPAFLLQEGLELLRVLVLARILSRGSRREAGNAEGRDQGQRGQQQRAQPCRKEAHCSRFVPHGA